MNNSDADHEPLELKRKPPNQVYSHINKEGCYADNQALMAIFTLIFWVNKTLCSSMSFMDIFYNFYKRGIDDESYDFDSVGSFQRVDKSYN